MPTWDISVNAPSPGLVRPGRTGTGVELLRPGCHAAAAPRERRKPVLRNGSPVGPVPLVGLATCATVIASQALISAAFSVTKQVIQLGYLPRLRILHTSENETGQIYIPFVNWALYGCIVMAVIFFGSSSKLAAAYGITVTIDMLITTVMTFFRDPLCLENGTAAVHPGHFGLPGHRHHVLQRQRDQGNRWRLVPTAHWHHHVCLDDDLEQAAPSSANACGLTPSTCILPGCGVLNPPTRVRAPPCS